MNQGLGLNKDHLTGFVVGVGVAAAGYYMYIRNKDKVDELLAGYGISIPSPSQEDYSKMTLEELMLKKETIEDIIAERELELEEGSQTGETPAQS